MHISGVKAVQAALQKAKDKLGTSSKFPKVVVGYTANYALYVHENIEMKGQGQPRASGKGNYWDPQGVAQAKYLEQPARQLKTVLGTIIRDSLKRGATLIHAMYMAGLRLQRESMRLVPVDTGNLKASAFTSIED